MEAIDSIVSILEQLPYILEFFIPGFIFLRIYQLLATRESSQYQIIISIIISYVLKAVCSILHDYIYVDVTFSWSRRVVILCALSVLLSFALTLISENTKVNDILLSVTHKSTHADIWRDVIDYKNGTTMRFTYEDKICTGILYEHEEKGNDSWFVLDDYVIDNPDGSNRYDSSTKEYPSKIAVNLKDAKMVQLFYGKTEDAKV